MNEQFGFFIQGAMVGSAVVFFLFLFGSIWSMRDKGDQFETYTRQIKIPAQWRNNDPDFNATIRDGIAIFNLGDGPCGETVEELWGSWSNDNQNFTVRQVCKYGSSKLFHYRREDITGRIEETFGRRLYKPKR
jgi:hypothetical protein